MYGFAQGNGRQRRIHQIPGAAQQAGPIQPVVPLLPAIPAPFANQGVVVPAIAPQPLIGAPTRGPLHGVSNQLLMFADKVSSMAGCNSAMMENYFELHELSRAGPSLITKKDYAGLINNVQQVCGLQTLIMCSTCGIPLKNQNARCGNRNCDRYRLRIHRARSHKNVVLRSTDLRRYISAMISGILHKLIKSHNDIHQTPHCDMTDPKYSPYVRGHMESFADFRRGMMVLPMAINTDGFTYKGTQRGTTWPFMALFLSLPVAQKQALRNMVMLSMYNGGKDPPAFVLRIIARKLAQFARTTRRRPLTFTLGNRTVYVKVCFVALSCDLKAHATLYNFSGWTSFYGCPFCLQRGVRLPGRAIRWPTLQNCARRTSSRALPGGVFFDSSSAPATHGFRGPSLFHEVVGSHLLLPDPLHSLSEGLLKDIHRGLVDGGGRPGLILTAIGRDVVKELSQSVYSTTSARTAVLDSSEFKSATGGQKEQMFVLVIVCASFYLTTLEEPMSGVINIFLGMLLRFMQNWKMDINGARGVSRLILQFLRCHRSFYGISYDTMKLHSLQHLASQILQWGNPLALGTTATESAYRKLKLDVSPMATRSFDKSSFVRLLTRQIVGGEISARCSNGDVIMQNYAATTEISHLDRQMLNRIPLLNGTFYSQADVLSPDAVAKLRGDDYVCFQTLRAASPSYTMISTRIGVKDNVYACQRGSASSVETQRTYVLVDVNGRRRVAKCGMFAIDPNTGRSVAHLKVYDTSDPIERLTNSLRHSAATRGVQNQPHVQDALELLRSLSAVNEDYFEYLPAVSNTGVLFCTQIVGPVSILSCRGRHFAVNQLCVPYHE